MSFDDALLPLDQLLLTHIKMFGFSVAKLL